MGRREVERVHIQLSDRAGLQLSQHLLGLGVGIAESIGRAARGLRLRRPPPGRVTLPRRKAEHVRRLLTGPRGLRLPPIALTAYALRGRWQPRMAARRLAPLILSAHVRQPLSGIPLSLGVTIQPLMC